MRNGGHSSYFLTWLRVAFFVADTDCDSNGRAVPLNDPAKQSFSCLPLIGKMVGPTRHGAATTLTKMASKFNGSHIKSGWCRVAVVDGPNVDLCLRVLPKFSHPRV